jgi:acyl carrier protein
MTAATDPLLDAVRSLVTRVAGPSRTPAESGPGTPLSGGGFWLDSVELLEVVIACEGELGVTFDAMQDLSGEAVATLGGLTELVRAKRARAHEGP